MKAVLRKMQEKPVFKKEEVVDAGIESNVVEIKRVRKKAVRPPSSEPWTKDDDARLRDLLKRGLSYVVIGQELGRSKNAIAGRVNRLGDVVRRMP